MTTRTSLRSVLRFSKSQSLYGRVRNFFKFQGRAFIQEEKYIIRLAHLGFRAYRGRGEGKLEIFPNLMALI